MRPPISAARASAAGLTSAMAPSGRCGKRASRAGSARAADQQNARRSPSRVIIRSRQRTSARWNWRIGRASRNSLASRTSGPGRQLTGTLDPLRGGVGERRGLAGAERGAGLHEPGAGGGAETGDRGGGAQGVVHERPAAGAEFGEHDGVGAALVGPHLGGPEADQLAEHLADLGGGDEIARHAQGVAGGVVAGDAEGHVGVEAERSLRRDAGAQVRRERGHARRAERTRRMRPARSIGNERSWPIVRPQSPRARTWPCGFAAVTNWASAWRKPSIALRARA